MPTILKSHKDPTNIDNPKIFYGDFKSIKTGDMKIFIVRSQLNFALKFHSIMIIYIHTQKYMDLGIGFRYIPIPNTQTQNCIWYQKIVCIEYRF